jgi:hypothetical protein
MEVRIMLRKRIIYASLVSAIVGVSVYMGGVYAHCDTMSGPVAVAARKALESGDLEPIQIWVGQSQDKKLEQRFQECLSVRKMGGQARELADRYFIETAIRLHRQAEGMSFTGVKPAQPLPPDIAAAEKALETGNIEIVTDLLNGQIKAGVQKWFDQAMQARKHKDESIEAGREWVDAYVKYVVYVHGLVLQIKAGPQHGVED